MKKTIHKEVFCEGTPDIVWEMLTDPQEISAWLMQTTDFKAETGAHFTLQAKPMGKWDGKIYGTVLVVEQYKKLSYTWKGDQMSSITTLTWTLLPAPGGTLLKMEHSGFAGFSDYVLGIFHAMGWGRFLRQLQKRIGQHGKGKI